MQFFDFHCDTPYRCYEENGDIFNNDFHISVSKAKYLEKWMQCMAIWIPDEYKGDNAFKFFKAVYDRFVTLAPDMLIKSREDFEKQSKGFIMTAEGGSVIAGDLDKINKLAQMGIKILTLTWNGANEIGGGADTDTGITPFGIKALAELERNNIIVDISHASDKLFYDVYKYHSKPFIATHSNSRKLCNHRRNLTDEQFMIIKDCGGVVGLNFCKNFLKEDGDATIEHIFAHAEHFLSLGGENTVAIGSDFDGADLPNGVLGIQSIGDIYNYFLSKNYSEALVKKIFFHNGYDFINHNIFNIN